MALTPITIDFETFWSQTYSLSKMTPIEYVNGSEYETQSCAIKVGDQPTEVYFGHDDIADAFAEIDWGNAIAIGHSYSEFDCLILSGKFGVNPRLHCCTLAMARGAGHAKTVGGSLKALAEHYGLQAKGSLEATNTKGLRLADFTPEMRAAMREYNKLDTDITYELFKILRKQTSADEMRLIDRTIRMLVEPRFECDVDLLRRGLKAERKRKERLLTHLSDKLGVPHDEEAIRKTCASAPKFKALLEGLGVEVPTKVSPTTGKEIPALAKTDQAMSDLQEHPDEVVQAAAMARLGVRSTILETRIERMITFAECYGGKMPVPLRYYGADTTGRWSGTMSVNLQNLPRVGKKAQISDVLRRSLRAPEGHKIVVADLSGIELRVTHVAWGVTSTIQAYAKNPLSDLYVMFAANLFSKPESDITKDERQLAKVAMLGLQFGVGWRKFKDVARLMGGIELSDDEAKRTTNTWRSTYREIVEGWKICDTAISAVYGGATMELDSRGLYQATKGGIRIPNGMIHYPGLHREGDEWWYGKGRSRARLYGPKVVENLTQATARQIFVDAMLRYERTEIGKRYPVTHHTHDELVVVAEDCDAQEALNTLQTQFRTPPIWWPDLVTWSEGSYAQTYGEAK